jgi:hypothetical protein
MSLLKIAVLFFCACMLFFSGYPQNPNVIVKCNEITADYQSNAKNKIKTASEFESDKKGKTNRKLKSKTWYDKTGCVIKSIYYSPGNSAGGNYAMTILEYNAKGYRTKLEEYKFDKDSVPVITFSESVVFDSLYRLKEKQSKRILLKDNAEYVAEIYSYTDTEYKISVAQNIHGNNSFPYTTRVFKYTSSSSASPDFTEIATYTGTNDFIKTVSVNGKIDEHITVSDGKTISHLKTIYERDAYGNLINEVQTNMLTGKKTQEIIHKSPNESLVVKYDNNGIKINEYDQNMPYGDPVSNRVSIGGYSYESVVKKDTSHLKNGNIRIAVYDKQYTNGKNIDKISQTLEYNKDMVLLKQDVEALSTLTVYEYEYY